MLHNNFYLAFGLFVVWQIKFSIEIFTKGSSVGLVQGSQSQVNAFRKSGAHAPFTLTKTVSPAKFIYNSYKHRSFSYF